MQKPDNPWGGGGWAATEGENTPRKKKRDVHLTQRSENGEKAQRTFIMELKRWEQKAEMLED